MGPSKRTTLALALAISLAQAQTTTPTVKLFLPALVDISNYSISASVISANPCSATYALQFPFQLYCNSGELASNACPPLTTKTISVTAAPTATTFQFSADQPYIVAGGSAVSYPEQVYQVCGPATSGSVACTESARITDAKGSVSTSTRDGTQYYNATEYNVPVTANAGALSSRNGGCTALGTGSLSTESTTLRGPSNTASATSVSSSAGSISSSSSHGVAPTADAMQVLRFGAIPAVFLGAAVLL